MRIRLIITLLTAVLLAACGTNETARLLDDVESYIRQHPDSALNALRRIDASHLGSKANRGHYSLLYAMALDKNYIDTTDMSVIQPALDYYDADSDPDHCMQAYYYLGRIQQNAGNSADAMQSFTTALDISKRSEDNYFKGLINSIISDIYSSKYSSKEALFYARQAFECFSHTPDTLRRWILLGRLAVCYGDNRDKATSDSLFKVYTKLPVLDTAIHAKNLLYYSKMLLGRKPSEPERCLEIFNEAKRKYHAKPRIEDYYFYSVALDKIGDKQAADRLLDRLEQFDTLSVASKNWRYILYKNRGDYHKALSLFEKTIIDQDSLIISMLHQSLERSQRKYYETKAQNEEQSKREVIIKFFMAVALLIVVLLLGVLLFVLYRRKQERRIVILENIREDLSKRLNVSVESKLLLDNRINDLRQKYDNQHKEHYKLLDDLCSAYFLATYKGQRDRVFDHVKEVLTKLTYHNSESSEVEKLANEELDNIMVSLREDLPNQNKTTYQLIAYDLLGFSPKTISAIMDISPASVYTRRCRIKEKIEKLSLEKQKKYTCFLDK